MEASGSHGSIICSVLVDDAKGKLFGPGDAPPFQYRFIDCNALVSDSVLQLVAFDDLPTGHYSAVSYIWKGLPPLKQHDDWIKAQGAEEIGNISLHVVRSACQLSLKYAARYLWLDCVCILQVDREDKAWQIRQMKPIYQGCEVCIVVPGGLNRLARFRLREQGQWHTRRWTLQECVLPKLVL